MQDVFNDFQLKEKVSCIVTNNGANIVKAVENLRQESIRKHRNIESPNVVNTASRTGISHTFEVDDLIIHNFVYSYLILNIFLKYEKHFPSNFKFYLNFKICQIG